MLSKEVYRILRKHLAPWCKANGFRRAKEALAWIRPLGERNLVFWFQCTQSGWEAHAGSQFTMEFQLARSEASGAFGDGRRQRLPGLLDDVQLEAVREIQNRVTAKLVLPPPDYFMFTMKSGSVDVAKWYRARFDPVLHPYAHNEDVWLRYHDDEDVVWWAAFILDKLPACVTKMESLAT